LAAERLSLRVRLCVALRRDALDRALAGGADPAASAELAFRAALLVRERNRRGLARCLRLAIWEAEAGVSAVRVSPRPVRRGEVLSCREALVALSDRLDRAGPAAPEGVAIAERLLNDLRSPLFAWAEPGTVRRLARLAAAAMDPPLSGHPAGVCGSSSTSPRAIGSVR
jgi:hypothetical protein